MSRRITFFVLATSATLIATQASADRECFEDSCRLVDAPEAAQLLPEPVEAAVPEASAAAQASVPAQASAPVQASVPVNELPQTAQVPTVLVPSAPAPTGLAPNSVPAKPLPQVVEMPEIVTPPYRASASRATSPNVTPYPQAPSPRLAPVRVAEPAVQSPPPVQTFTDEAPLPRERVAAARQPRERVEMPVRDEKAKPVVRYSKPAQPAPVRLAGKPLPAPAPVVDEEPETVAAAAPVRRPRPVRVSSTEPGYVQGYNQGYNQVAAAGIVVVVPPVTQLTGRYLFAPNAKIISIDSDD